ncbi:TIGR02147 family protein [Bacteriovoracaceae bacterium]|nr:TIGR02147 family protein [Bacteriovoracaceae bacterium]
MNDYQNILIREYENRLNKNKAYSLRAFALSLNLSPSALSEIIKGKRGLSVKKAETILERLNLNYRLSQSFIESVKKTKANYKSKVSEESLFDTLSEDQFKVISEWQYYAILNLINLDDFQSNPRWIGKRLNLNYYQVKICLEKLVSLGLIKINNNEYVRTNVKIKSTDNIQSMALRHHHKQMLEKASESLLLTDIEKRDITSITMAIDVDKIVEAKILIKKFRRKLSNFLESGKKSDVYNLNIQLFPITNQKDKK